jgi:acyl carrier protein
MLNDHVEEALRRFVVDNSNIGDASFIRDETDLLAAGILDSLIMVALVAFCEEQFACVLEPEDLTEDRFRSIDALAALVRDKMKGAAEGA